MIPVQLIDSKELLRNNKNNYGPYKDLFDKKYMSIHVSEFTEDNINYHIDSIINMFKDGIDVEELHSIFINLMFADGLDVDLSIEDYLMQLIFIKMPLSINEPLTSENLFFSEGVTVGYISRYINMALIKKIIRNIKASNKPMGIQTRMEINNIINEPLEMFKKFGGFQQYLNNTLCLEDTLDLMNMYPEFNASMHLHFAADGMALEDMAKAGMDAALLQKKYITAPDSEHCLKYFFISGEGVAIKQYKEVGVHVGPKPNGMGGIIPSAIDNSYLNGGLNTVEAYIIDASASRVAQMLSHENVGRSGDFARILQLNNTDTKLQYDPNYKCKTAHLLEIYIKDKATLSIYDMRYYRFYKPGTKESWLEDDHIIDADNDFFLIGRTIYMYSPETCKSNSDGYGICYRCYGDLAYFNSDINIGVMASELITRIYTQRQLSAKHILEARVRKLIWNINIEDIFEVNFNALRCYDDSESETNPYRGMVLILKDIQYEDENDDLEFNAYVCGFSIRFPDGSISEYHTVNSDNIYLSEELNDIVEYTKKKTKSYEDDDEIIEIKFDDLIDMDSIFLFHINNDELSRIVTAAKRHLNNSSEVVKYDYNSFLNEFVRINMSGGINLNSVHYETIISNQIRDANDSLLMPDWGDPNVEYKILTLDKSLIENPSVTISLQYQKILKQIYNPITYRKSKASSLDLFAMVNPQEYITQPGLVDKNKYVFKDTEDKVETIRFVDKKNE